MAERGRPKAPLVLTDEERETLVRWSRRRKSAQSLALRGRIVVAGAEGKTNKAVAEELRVWTQTVTKWRGRFVRERLEGLSDEPRPGAARTITDEQVEAVVVATLEELPKDATHWSRALMAKRSGLSKSTVGRVWKGFVQTRKGQNPPRAAAPAGAADDARHARAAHPRLPAQRHLKPVRRPGRGHRQGGRARAIPPHAA